MAGTTNGWEIDEQEGRTHMTSSAPASDRPALDTLTITRIEQIPLIVPLGRE